MSRTLDPVAHAARRDEYVDAAEALLRQGGCAALNVQDVIAAAGGSKGGFYHYFASKQDLLAAVVERMTSRTADAVRVLVDGPGDAVTTFAAVVHAMPAGQPGNRELMLALLQVWYADDNAALREATRQASHSALRPSLETLLARGRDEGAFTVGPAAGASDVLATLLLGMSDAAARSWLARQRGEITLDEGLVVLESYADAAERVLGVAPGTAFPRSPELVRSWLE